jgi:hypothetical protein
MGEKRNVYKVSAGKTQGKRSFEIPKHRQENYIKTDLMETERDDTDRSNLVKDRDNKIWVPKMWGNS